MTTTAANIARVLGIGGAVMSMNDLRLAVSRGLPKRSLVAVTRYVLPQTAEATALRNQLIPIATYKRRTTRLKPDESERVERVARVMALAEDAFGSSDDARAFLQTPHPELNGESPLAVARSEIGARQVEEVLWRMEQGLPL